ncbi:prepilin-type N-terminal cleavage/methylation domain-containing protein [Escherichia coli]
MSASLKNQQGFSLPEVMVAMVLMVMIVTALSGIQRTLMNSLASRNQYQQLWRHGWQQTQLRAICHLPTGRSTQCRHRRWDVSA